MKYGNIPSDVAVSVNANWTIVPVRMTTAGKNKKKRGYMKNRTIVLFGILMVLLGGLCFIPKSKDYLAKKYDYVKSLFVPKVVWSCSGDDLLKARDSGFERAVNRICKMLVTRKYVEINFEGKTYIVNVKEKE